MSLDKQVDRWVSPLSSVFSVVFLNFFHQEANSRLEGGEIAGKGEGAGARCACGTMGRGEEFDSTPPVAISAAAGAVMRSCCIVGAMTVIVFQVTVSQFWLL